MACLFLTAFSLFTLLTSGHLYEYRMANATGCPKNQLEVIIATTKLGCGQDKYGNNQYMCLPNKNKSVLLEFCYVGVMGIQESGICLEISEGKLIEHSCKNFSYGCPETDFFYYELYKYPACQDINTQFRCYVSDPGCLPRKHTEKPFNQYNIVCVMIIFGYLVLQVIFGFIMICLWRRRKRNERKKEKEEEIRIILLGYNRAGKSATANTILGKCSKSSSLTKTCVRQSNRFGCNIKIVDTPEIFDPSTEDEHIQKEIRNGISLTSPGPHVFIIVLDKARFPLCYQKTLEYFVKIFGEDMYKYVILLFTNEDCKREESLKDLNEIFPLELKTKIEKCGGRVRDFNNQLGWDQRDALAEELITLIREVIQENDNGCYTYKIYEEKTEK